VTTTTTTEMITESSTTEPPPYEYITFNPEFNEIPDDSYNIRPHMNIAYSTSGGVKLCSEAFRLISLIFIVKIFSSLR
jgi:hypothetical protein